MSKCELCQRQGNCVLESEIVFICPLFKSDREQTYSEKGNHKERSKFHQPQHNRHWGKEEKKNPPEK